ncbi:glutamine amidotransferase [Gordonia sp. TBRC 11910]|uniref:Glutamine amidotransferase n=1 Tax=Gordonia asplenii TaxID=2725283 RepID=A0A848KSB0_9ACTN|nr:glutamine amidotransferase [Gordonia asplenii]NMO00867.1 glutamine amidotransferase [Gordonia asplenii]
MPDANAPFLLLSIRAEHDAAAEEYDAVMRFGGLDESRLRRIVLTRQPLGRIDLDDWSGIVLGGGPFNVSDPSDSKSQTQKRTEAELFDLLTRVVAEDFPFLGCCYGVGTLGAVIGATVDRTHSEPVGGLTVTLTADGTADPIFAPLPATFDAYGGHKEAASVLPAQAVTLASSAACPIQAFRVGANVYATQFHAELDLDGLCTRIDAYRNHGYFAPETADQLKADARHYDVTHTGAILRRFVERYSR